MGRGTGYYIIYYHLYVQHTFYKRVFCCLC
nr:MAG TPA: hypothetical protein [Caudoviricetes sp.]